MYRWDIKKLDSSYAFFQKNKSAYSSDERNFLLSQYIQIYEFIDGVYGGKVDNTNKSDDFYLRYAKDIHESMKASKILETPLFKEMINQNGIENKPNSIITNYDYSETQAVNMVKCFLSGLSKCYTNWFQNLIDSNSLCLRKNPNISGFMNRLNANHTFIGVLAPNIEAMMYILIHEFGHYINVVNGLAGSTNNETLPMLLELYLFDYLNKKGFDSLSYFQERYITIRNEELLSLKVYNETYHSTDDMFIAKRIGDLINDGVDACPFDDTIDYCLSKYRAINHYRETKSRPQTIIKSISENKNKFTLSQMFETISPIIFSEENEAVVRKLVR